MYRGMNTSLCYHTEYFLKLFCALPIPPSPHFQPLVITHLFTVCLILPFLECHIIGITQHVTFSNWIPSLNNVHLIQVFSWLDNPFLFHAI